MNYKNINQFKSDTGYDIEGIGWVPRVTSITSIKAKPALYRYYGGLSSFDEGEKIKEISANEGTLVHETIQDILTGKDREIDNDIRPAIEAAIRFAEEHKIEIIPEFVERRIVNEKELYAGTTDALAIIDGKLGVLDIKTSQSIYRDYNLQTSAYIASLIDTVDKLETGWIFRIDQHRLCHKCTATKRLKGGREKITLPWDKNDFRVRLGAVKCNHEWSPIVGSVELKESNNWKEDYSAFLSAKKLWEWENEYWLKKVGYLK